MLLLAKTGNYLYKSVTPPCLYSAIRFKRFPNSYSPSSESPVLYVYIGVYLSFCCVYIIAHLSIVCNWYFVRRSQEFLVQKMENYILFIIVFTGIRRIWYNKNVAGFPASHGAEEIPLFLFPEAGVSVILWKTAKKSGSPAGKGTMFLVIFPKSRGSFVFFKKTLDNNIPL